MNMDARDLGMRELKELRRLTEQYAKEIETKAIALAVRIEGLRQRVASGEWKIEDPIAGYFLREHSTIDEEVAEPLYELEKVMRGKKGQLFLVVWEKRERHERHRFGGDTTEQDYCVKGSHFMGVLSDERLVLCENKRSRVQWSGCGFGLPTEEFLDVGMTVRAQGPFLFPLVPLAQQGSALGASEAGQTEIKWEVIIGDAEVLGHQLRGSKNEIWTDLLKDAARALGKNV